MGSTEMSSETLETLKPIAVKDEVTEEETQLASRLRACCSKSGIEKQIRLHESAGILLEMGKLYVEKAKNEVGMSQKLLFIKAAALVAGAEVRFQVHLRDEGSRCKARSEYSRLFRCVLEACDRRNSDFNILTACDGVKSDLEVLREEERTFIRNKLPPLDTTASEAKLSDARRQRVNLMKELLGKCHLNYLRLMKFISKRCISILGDPPCAFALVGLGSIAREEVTLYSDFEHMILLEDGVDDSNGGEIREYFRWYSVIFQIVIIGLGETYIPSVGVKSINDLYSENKTNNWFFDLYTPGGISFDGRFPHSCKMPLGKQEPSKNRKHVVELIQPITKMLRYLTDQENENNGYHLREMLVRTVFLHGHHDIYRLFNGQIGSVVGFVTYKEAIAQQSAFIVKNVNPFLRSAGGDMNKMDFAKIKDFFYRPITLLITALSRCCLRSSASSLEFVSWFRDAITQEDKPSAEEVEPYLQDLEYAIAVACEIRAKLYASAGQQRQKALPQAVSNFVSKSCVARCFQVIKITTQLFHTAWEIKPDFGQFFDLLVELKSQTPSACTSDIDSHILDAFGFIKPTFRPAGSKLGSDEQYKVLIDAASTIGQPFGNAIDRNEDVDGMLNELDQANETDFPVAMILIKANVLLLQKRFSLAFEALETGWKQAVENDTIRDPIVLQIGLQACKAGDSLTHMDSKHAIEHLANQANCSNDTLSKSVFKNYLCVAFLRAGEVKKAREALTESFRMLEKDAKKFSPAVVSAVLQDILVVQCMQSWKNDEDMTISLLRLIGEGDRFKYLQSGNPFEKYAIANYLLPYLKEKTRQGYNSSSTEISDTVKKVAHFRNNNPNDTHEYAKALSILLYKTGIENFDKIIRHFRVAPDAVLKHPLIFHSARISITWYCKLVKNFPFWKVGRDLAAIFEVFAHQFEDPYFISSAREITNAVVMTKLDLLKILEELVKEYNCDGMKASTGLTEETEYFENGYNPLRAMKKVDFFKILEELVKKYNCDGAKVITMLYHFVIEHLPKFDFQFCAKFLWKILFSKNAKRKVKEYCCLLLPQIIQIIPFANVVEYLKGQRQDFMEKLSSDTPKVFRLAVEDYTNYRFHASSSSLWKIMSSPKIKKPLLQRSIILLNYAILLHLESEGFAVAVKDMFVTRDTIATNEATKAYPPQHVVMGDLHFGLWIASKWPDQTLKKSR